MANMSASGQNVETLQRQERTVDGKPAQMIRIRYQDEAERPRLDRTTASSSKGPISEIYSVALKCASRATIVAHSSRQLRCTSWVRHGWKLGTSGVRQCS